MIYLDTSTLSNAFSAYDLRLTGGHRVDAAYRPLLPWIERTASSANLCLSLFHFKDLAGWGDHGRAHALVEWLAELPTVWTRGPIAVERSESEEWLRIALGCTTRVPADPFAPSMVAAMEEITIDASVASLQEPSTRRHFEMMLDACRAVDSTRERTEMPHWATVFREDRAWAEHEGWTDERKRQHLAARADAELRERALEAHARLCNAVDVEYPRDFDGDVAAALQDLVRENSKAMPWWRVSHRFVEEWAARAAKWTEGSQSQRKSSSTLYDYVHLSVGAAYCEVFTCDAQVYRCLGDVRGQIGFKPALTAAGAAPSVFVEALTRSVG